MNRWACKGAANFQPPTIGCAGGAPSCGKAAACCAPTGEIGRCARCGVGGWKLASPCAPRRMGRVRAFWAEAPATCLRVAANSGWSTRPECGLRRPAEDAGARVASGWPVALTAVRPPSLRRVAAKGTRVGCSTRSSQRPASFGQSEDGGAAQSSLDFSSIGPGALGLKPSTTLPSPWPAGRGVRR